jgi:hypothetical protein
VEFGNPSATCYACYGGEDKEASYTLVGCKCICQGGLVNGYSGLLRILGRVTSFGWERLAGKSWWLEFSYVFPS